MMLDFVPVNGEVIVTLLPLNERFPWVTPARFRPELVPEELLAPVLTVSSNLYHFVFHLLQMISAFVHFVAIDALKNGFCIFNE